MKGSEWLRTLAIFFLVFWTSEAYTQSTFTVTSVADTPDANPGDGICADSSGVCTFRAALMEANTTVQRDVIRFNISGNGPHRIFPLTALPLIIAPLHIDGRTQQGYLLLQPVIILDGQFIPNQVGLVFQLQAANSQVLGLSMGNFSRPLTFRSPGARVEACLIGIAPDGTAMPNSATGISLEGAAGSLIGGAQPAQGNIIVSNSLHGLLVSESPNVQISHNYVGLHFNGETMRANGTGLRIELGSTGIIIADNVIAGNETNGVITATCGGALLIRNTIGTNAAGTKAMRDGTGFSIRSSNNRIGGSVAEGNLISGHLTKDALEMTGSQNHISGNIIGLNREGTASLPNGIGVHLIGGTQHLIGGVEESQRNWVSGNNTGILLENVSNTRVEGNYIGLSKDGLVGIGNNQGVSLLGNCQETVVGGDFGVGTNWVSGNQIGINLFATGSNNRVVGNIVGLNVALMPAPNSSQGIWLRGGGTNLWVGGPRIQDRNIVSGNSNTGIQVSNTVLEAFITGNYVGTHPDGTTALGNGGAGLVLASGNGIGLHIYGNLFSGNLDGVRFTTNASNYKITNNKIGTDITGTKAIPNLHGVRFTGEVGANNLLGGTQEEGNLIAGNAQFGVRFGNEVQGQRIAGNRIGITEAGLPLPNGTYGVGIATGASNHQVGTGDPAYANIIAFNAQGGILLDKETGAFPLRNQISVNSIFSNKGPGIQLAPSFPSLNDPVDADEGANRLQNFPVINQTFTYHSTTQMLQLAYFVPTAPPYADYPLKVEFFIDDGQRQGRQYLYTDTFTLEDYAAHTPKSLTFSVAGKGFQSGDVPVATATDGRGNTSEFGAIVPDAPTATPVAICLGEVAHLTAAGATDGDEYLWYSSVSAGNPVFVGNMLSLSGLPASTTYFVAIRMGGMISTRIPVPIQVTQPPVVERLEIIPQTDCRIANGGLELVLSQVPDGSYEFSFHDGTFGQVEVIEGFVRLIADWGVYANVHMVINNCTFFLGIYAVVPDERIFPELGLEEVVPQTNCEQPNGMILLALRNVPNGMQTFQYAGGAFEGVEVSDGVATLVVSEGEYRQLVFDREGCLSAPLEVVVSGEYRYPVPPVGEDVSRCGPGPLTLVVTGASGEDTYRWFTSPEGGDPVAVGPEGILHFEELAISRQFYVESRTPLFCSSDRVSVRALVGSILPPEINTPNGTAFCAGSALPLAGPVGMAEYRWSDGARGQTNMVATPGLRSLVVVDLIGCESAPSAPVSIQEWALPKAEITYQNGTLVANEEAGYQWYFNQKALPGSTQRQYALPAIAFGLYTVQTTNVEGCQWVSEPFAYLITDLARLAEKSDQFGIHLFPNPVGPTLSAWVGGASGPFDWTIVDLSGKVWLGARGERLEGVSVGLLPPGVYVLWAENQERAYSSRLIKQ
jgi:CSLREA domain-containing protein